MDDHHHHETVEGLWPGGWLVAAVAGLFAALVARVIGETILLGLGAYNLWCAYRIGETGISPAVLMGSVTFLVFGVLLGSGGVELTLDAGHGDDHGHGHH